LRAAHCPFANPPETRASRWGGSLTAEKMNHDAFCVSLSIGSIAHEIDLPASEARKTANAAISRGSTNRCRDWIDIADFFSSSTDLPLSFARLSRIHLYPRTFDGTGQDRIGTDAEFAQF